MKNTEPIKMQRDIEGTHFAHARVTHHILDGEHVHYLSFVDTAFGVTCNTNHNNITYQLVFPKMYNNILRIGVPLK